MVACYRAASRGKYFQHIDSGGGAQRLLTAILYCNPGSWTHQDGGCNRMYSEGWFSTTIKEDILPLGNRLLLFWGDEDCPHEVTAAVSRDRYAMTIFTAHGPTLLRERLGTAQGRKEIVDDFEPLRPHSFAEAAALSAPELRSDPVLAELSKVFEKTRAGRRWHEV